MVEGWWSFRAGAEQDVLGYDKHTDDVKPAAMGVDWAELGRPYWHEAGHDWFETPPWTVGVPDRAPDRNLASRSSAGFLSPVAKVEDLLLVRCTLERV